MDDDDEYNEYEQEILERERRQKLAIVNQRRIGDSRTAYERYIRGEAEFGKEPGLREFLTDLYTQAETLCTILWGHHEIPSLASKAPAAEAASRCLFDVCRAPKTRLYHIYHLLELKADVNYADPATFDTPLHWLARRSSLTGIKLLLANGANPLIRSNRLRNVLMEACDTKRVGVQVRIVRYLARLPQFYRQRDVLHLEDTGGNTALMSAVFNNNVWIVRELLLAGAWATKRTKADSTAYSVAMWIYAAGLQLDIHELPHESVWPDSLLYKLFSLKGHYQYAPLLAFQNMWKYNAELIFRVLQRAKRLEDKERKVNPEIDQPKPSAVESVARMRDDRELAAARAAAQARAEQRSQRDRKIRKLLDRKKKKEADQLEEWNRTRKNLADRVDREFSEAIHGKGGEEAAAESNKVWAVVVDSKQTAAQRTWKAVPRPAKGIYRPMPSMPGAHIERITMEQMVTQQLSNTLGEKIRAGDEKSFDNDFDDGFDDNDEAELRIQEL